MAHKAMKNNTTKFIASDPKAPTERFFVLKPPVAAILKAWFTASNNGMPATHKERNVATVNEA
jgi:hypothetical protein